jgi:hypothetical protein
MTSTVHLKKEIEHHHTNSGGHSKSDAGALRHFFSKKVSNVHCKSVILKNTASPHNVYCCDLLSRLEMRTVKQSVLEQLPPGKKLFQIRSKQNKPSIRKPILRFAQNSACFLLM